MIDFQRDPVAKGGDLLWRKPEGDVVHGRSDVIAGQLRGMIGVDDARTVSFKRAMPAPGSRNRIEFSMPTSFGNHSRI